MEIVQLGFEKYPVNEPKHCGSQGLKILTFGLAVAHCTFREVNTLVGWKVGSF